MDTQLTPDARTLLIDAVAAHVPPARGQDCVRVAVDGVDGAGKTWFANDLADTLRLEGRPVVRVSTDDWHHQRSRRYAHGRTSPLGFWLDSYDHHRIRHEVLEPLGPGGTRWFRRRGHDLRTDATLHDPLEAAPACAVIVVDGLFLQRAELQDCFELVIWLQVPFGITARPFRRPGLTPTAVTSLRWPCTEFWCSRATTRAQTGPSQEP